MLQYSRAAQVDAFSHLICVLVHYVEPESRQMEVGVACSPGISQKVDHLDSVSTPTVSL